MTELKYRKFSTCSSTFQSQCMFTWIFSLAATIIGFGTPLYCGMNFLWLRNVLDHLQLNSNVILESFVVTLLKEYFYLLHFVFLNSTQFFNHYYRICTYALLHMYVCSYLFINFFSAKQLEMIDHTGFFLQPALVFIISVCTLCMLWFGRIKIWCLLVSANFQNKTSRYYMSCIMCWVVLLRVVAWAWRRGQRVCLSRVAARDQRHASHVRDASKLSQSSVSSGRRRTRLNLSVLARFS